MKKLLGILVLGLVLVFGVNANAEETICLYEDILNKKYPCDNGPRLKKELDVTIVAHFYQRDEVIQYADYVGDSFQLAQAAKNNPSAEHIVFCGVHFMAETADVITSDNVTVSLPNLAAGCSMADMADTDSVEDAWEQLTELYRDETETPIIPVTYMNSSAALKAFCGKHGGIVCTSSNAERVLKWAFKEGKRVLFFPDQHLGRNTAKSLGVPLEKNTSLEL